MQFGATWCSLVQLGAVWCNLIQIGACMAVFALSVTFYVSRVLCFTVSNRGKNII